MTQVDLSSYRDLYLKTAKEYLQKLTNDLQAIKENPDNTQALEEAHLCAHSIGSQSLTMQYESTGNLSRTLEHFLSNVKEGSAKIDPKKLGLLIEATSKISQSVSNIETDNSELNVDQETNDLKQKLNLQ